MKDHHNVTSLPFVSKCPNGKRHCFWVPVPPTENELKDGQRGREFAHEYFEFEAQNQSGAILSLILWDMCESGDRGIVARNFVISIANALRAALQDPFFFDSLQGPSE